MAVGGYFVGVQGMDRLQSALSEVPHGLRDLRKIHQNVARLALQKSREDVPVYGFRNSRRTKPNHAGRGWAGTGHLSSTLKATATKDRASIRVGDAKTGYLIVQMFGGTSYWHRMGAGVPRASNRGHKPVSQTGSRTIRVGRHQYIGHVIYKKPHKRLGYFVWNVAYQLRTPIARTWSDGVGELIAADGLAVNMAANPDLGIKQTYWSGGMAA